MGEMKPTPGEWFCGDWIPADHNTAGWVEVWTVDAEGNRSLPFVSCKHFDAGDNARLIAEAGTVFHNTGLSPVQLVEMVRELRTALQDAEEYISGHTPTNSWGLLDRREDADRCETLEKVRVALAKCEGVGNG